MNPTFAHRLDDLPESATLKINRLSQQYIKEGRKIYKFGLGQSPFPVPPHIVEELRQNAHQKDYLPVEGLRELRMAIATYRSSKHGVTISPENVMVGPGSKELLFLLQLCYNGNLLLPNPSWVSYAPQAHIIGRKVHWIDTTPENDWKLQPSELEQMCLELDGNKNRLLLLNSPCNPTGATYTSDELLQIAEVARRHNLCVMSDEIYGGCTFSGGREGHRGQSIATHYPEGTIIFGGISKWAGAGGWRLGACSFPDQLTWLKKRMCAVASETYTSVSSPIQYAAVRLYDVQNPDTEAYLKATQTILGALAHHVTYALRSCGAKVSEPGGGFYVFPDIGACPRIMKEGFRTSTDMCSHILETTGVAMLPGSCFGRPSNEMTVRLSFVHFNGTHAIERWTHDGCPSIKGILEKGHLHTYCPETLEGIQKLTEYLAQK